MSFKKNLHFDEIDELSIDDYNHQEIINKYLVENLVSLRHDNKVLLSSLNQLSSAVSELESLIREVTGSNQNILCKKRKFKNFVEESNNNSSDSEQKGSDENRAPCHFDESNSRVNEINDRNFIDENYNYKLKNKFLGSDVFNIESNKIDIRDLIKGLIKYKMKYIFHGIRQDLHRFRHNALPYIESCLTDEFYSFINTDEPAEGSSNRDEWLKTRDEIENDIYQKMCSPWNATKKRISINTIINYTDKLNKGRKVQINS